MAKRKADDELLRRRNVFWHDAPAICLAVVQKTWELAEYLPQTVRSYYYALLAGYLTPYEGVKGSARQAYQWVSRLLTDAREDGRLDWAAVEDAGHTSRAARYHDSLHAHVARLGVSDFQLDVWRGQDRRIIVWTEKEGELGNLWAICAPYRVPVDVAGGFGSASVIHNAAMDYADGKDVRILYVGDADPSGFDIQRDLLERLHRYGAPNVAIRRVFVTDDQAHGLHFDAEQDLKSRDSRIARFKREHPTLEHGYEMQALSFADQRRLLSAAIESEVDMPLLREALRLERTIRTWIT